MTIAIVIATRHRPEPLKECLQSIGCQSRFPDLLVIVDSSNDSETEAMVETLRNDLRFKCLYHRCREASAAVQRNIGADFCATDLLLFLDDDVVLERDFVSEIGLVFESSDPLPAGVSGTISNCVYVDPKGLNRLLLAACIGELKGSYAGRVVGPAVNFIPADGENATQEVEWLPTTCTAYRRDVFLDYLFEKTFEGYSFAEDLHLATRIAQKHLLLNTTRARAFHADLGKDTHRDWKALGESQVRNRHLIMTSVLGRKRGVDHLRLFGYEMIYCSVAYVAAGCSLRRISRLIRLLHGKLLGFWKLLSVRKLQNGSDVS